jgi:hypothetical protein
MTQTEKNIKVLKGFLEENGIQYKENMAYRGVVMDVCVPKMMIAVHYGDDQDFFQTTKKYYAPFCIREEESEAKTLEKIQNCCIMQMKRMQYMAEHNGKRKWVQKKSKKGGKK